MVRGFSPAVRILCAAVISLLPLLGALPLQAAQPVPLAQDEPVGDLDGVESAVVQIEAVGTFADPSEGRQQNVPGFGSGFIIDPSGIAVTNNHVVTGGALFRVYVSGREEPVNAKVLGVSECSDLAVIDLQGSNYPYLSWYEGTPRVGLDVYAAGFPLGDPEFTLTRGIVSKARASGESNWASLPSVIMHDAEINPGNSGGPLVTEDGAIVGVNYAVDQENDQSFAIPGTLAQEVVATLREGVDLDSLGINAEAYDDGEGFSAIYVYSVASGSPADVVGILPGDFLLEIEGLVVGLGGTMEDYCDILASHDSTDVMSVKVFRPDTEEVLEGQLNGRALATSFSVADEVAAQADGGVETGGAEYTYVPLSDAAGIVNLEVPDAWADTGERDWVIDGEAVGTQLFASSDAETFFKQWDIPGVIFSFSDQIQEDWTPEELVGSLDYSDQCTYVGRTDLPADGFFQGVFDEYKECGDSGTAALVAGMVPETGGYILGVEVYAVTEADLAALDHILDTFVIEAGASAAATAEGVTVGEDIFDRVDVAGLQHDYTFFSDPYFNAVVPAEWTDSISEDWIGDDDEVLGKVVIVAPDVQEYRDSWAAPGLSAYLITDVGEDFDAAEVLGSGGFSDQCTLDDTVENVEHEIYGVRYTGLYEVYVDCDGADTIFYTGVFGEESGTHAYFVDLVAASEADDEAWDVLLQSFFLGAAVQPEVNADEYTPVSDESGRISLSVPKSWTDAQSEPWEVDGEQVGIKLTVAPDVQEYNDSWEAAGAAISVWDEFGELDADELLDDIDYSDECEYDARYDYDDDSFVGRYDLWTNCGDVAGSVFGSFVLQRAGDDQTLVLLSVGLPHEEDLAALEPILTTLAVQPAAGDAVPQEPPVEEPVSEQDGDALVTIIAETLNVRTGPGTEYERTATIDRDAVLLAVGQWNNCAWLLVEDVEGTRGWVSGDSRYTRLEGDCAALPVGDVLAAPAASAPPAQVAGNSAATIPANQGCVTFTNNWGVEVNVTWTRASDGWNTFYTIGKGASNTRCLDAGKYTFTVASWDGASANQELTIAAGDNVGYDLNP